jgi:hypothetical protein
VFVLASVLAAGPPSVQAAEWSWAPTLTFWLDHDSNRYLWPGGVPSEGVGMSLDLQLQYATERFGLTLHPQVQLLRFDEPEYHAANDASLAGAANYVTGRSTLGLNTTLSEATLLTSELPVTGIVEPGTRRREEDAGASWTYAQSETRALTLQANSVDVSFQSSLPASEALLSYHGLNVSATEQVQRTATLALFGTVSAGTYDEEGLPKATRTDGLVIGFKSQLSERTTLNADAGASRTTLLSLTQNGLLADLTLTRTGETGNLSVSASRNVAPVGFAEITQQDTLRLAVQRNLSERLSANAAVSLNRYASVFSIPGLITIDLPYLDRTYSQATLGLNWQETETWTVGVQASTTRLQGATVANAEDWAVQVRLAWAPHAQSVSR